MSGPYLFLKVPASLVPTDDKASGIRFVRMLRDPELVPFLISAVRQSTELSDADRNRLGAELLAWLVSWIAVGARATEAEQSEFSVLITVAHALISGGREGPAAGQIEERLIATHPSARAWASFLAEEGGIRVSSPILAQVPVVFANSTPNPNIPAEGMGQVARLELRLIPEAKGVHVHPADQWRRTLTQSRADHAGRIKEFDDAAAADPDFVKALEDAVNRATVYRERRGKTVPSGAVLWRLLDFDADQPFHWQGPLKGPSIGGAALRGILHLLDPQRDSLDKYVFVLAQLRDSSDQLREELQPVDSIKEKIANAIAAVGARNASLRHCAYFVLPQMPQSPYRPESVGAEQIQTNVRTVEQLAVLKSPFTSGNVQSPSWGSETGTIKEEVRTMGKTVLWAVLAVALLLLCVIGIGIKFLPRTSAGPTVAQTSTDTVPPAPSREKRDEPPLPALRFEQAMPGPDENPTFIGHNRPVFRRDAPALPPAPEVENTPSPLALKEHKQVGSVYNCEMVTQINGRADKSGWMVVEGGCFFTIETLFKWQEKILKNDGIELIVERHFSESALSEVVRVSRFGLTDTGAQGLNIIGTGLIKLGATIGDPHTALTGKFILTAGMVGRSDRLAALIKETPFLGPIAEREISDLIRTEPEARAIEGSQKTLGKIKGETVVLKWSAGKLMEIKYSSGAALSPTDVKFASLAGGYADLNLLPSTAKKVNETWLIQAAHLSQFFNLGDGDLKENVKGTIRIIRNEDHIPGKLASLGGGGKGSYNGIEKKFNFVVESLDADVNISPDNQYVSRTQIEGRFAHATISAPDSPLQGVQFKVEPSFIATYTCENVSPKP